MRFFNQNRLEFQIPRSWKKVELTSQGTYNFRILENETLIISDYKYAKIVKFAMLDIKL